MNRKMTALALPTRGWEAALAGGGSVSAARRRSSRSSAARASAPKPQKDSPRNSRRVRARRTCSAILIHIEQVVEVEQGQGKLPKRLIVEVGKGDLLFGGGGRAPQCQPEGPLHLPHFLRPGLPLEPLGKGFGQLIGHGAVEQLQRLRSVRARRAARAARLEIRLVEHF